jgi:hypothetical protein
MGTATVGTVSTTSTAGEARAGRDPEQLKSTLLTAGAVAAAVAAYVTSAASGDAQGRMQTALLVVGAVLAGLTVLLGALEKRRAQRRLATAEQVAVEAEAGLMLTLNGALAPITNYLGDMADQRTADGRATVAGQLSQAVVDAAVRLTADGARSAFYQLDEDWQGLTREVWGGRSSQPRGAFIAGTPDGDAVLDVVRAGDYVVIDDVEASPMVTPSAGAGYRTVVAVAVTAGSLPLGLLTVDAPRVGDLGPTDVELLRVLANLLGAGLAQV